jgi:copper chaperone CopZ
MISYSFYKVYFDPSIAEEKKDACCQTGGKETLERRLRTNRAIVWFSLGVAVVGASYGRVSFPKQNIRSILFSSNSKLLAGASIGKNLNARSITLKLHVGGMHCNGCANRVQNAIQSSVSGIENVLVDHKAGHAVVVGKDIKAADIKKTIEKLGYTVDASRG